MKLPALLLCALLLTGCSAVRPVTPQPPAPVPVETAEVAPANAPMVDKDYLLALRTADEFLDAWLNGDENGGVNWLAVSLSDKERYEFFNGMASPHHQGYELAFLDRPNADTLRFQVRLYLAKTGEIPAEPTPPAPLALTVARTGQDRWQVAALPAPLENSPGSADGKVDSDLLKALNTADHFLFSWLRRDWVKGGNLLSEELATRLGPEKLKRFFSGISNPHHQAYELAYLDRSDANTIRINVWLYEYYTGENPPPTKRLGAMTMMLTRNSQGQWRVDALPGGL